MPEINCIDGLHKPLRFLILQVQLSLVNCGTCHATSLRERNGMTAVLGGRGTYPYTVVLDKEGTIVDIFLSSLEYEDLKEAVEKQLSE